MAKILYLYRKKALIIIYIKEIKMHLFSEKNQFFYFLALFLIWGDDAGKLFAFVGNRAFFSQYTLAECSIMVYNIRKYIFNLQL